MLFYGAQVGCLNHRIFVFFRKLLRQFDIEIDGIDLEMQPVADGVDGVDLDGDGHATPLSGGDARRTGGASCGGPSSPAW